MNFLLYILLDTASKLEILRLIPDISGKNFFYLTNHKLEFQENSWKIWVKKRIFFKKPGIPRISGELESKIF